MRKNLFFRSVAIAVLALIVATLPVLAGSTTKTLSTNYSVVNLSTVNDASVTALYYKDDGSTWTADADKTNFTVAKNYGQYQVRQYFDTTLTAGKGSVVLSSTEPLAAIVQIQARGQTPTMGAYTGYTSGSNQFFVPLVLRKFPTASGVTNTQIMIQNIMNEAISVSVQFTPRPGGGAAFLKTFPSVPKFSTQYYDIADELSSNLQDAWIGSATVTAQTGKQIAVVVNVFAGADGMQTTNAFPVENIGTTWAVPQFASKLPNGFNTTINLQNVTSTEIAAGAITLECNPEAGFSGTISKTNLTAVPGNAAYAFNPVDAAQGFPTNWQGACVVTSPQNIVVFNQLRRPGITGDISAYECFLTSSSNSKVVVPLVAKRLANGFCQRHHHHEPGHRQRGARHRDLHPQPRIECGKPDLHQGL